MKPKYLILIIIVPIIVAAGAYLTVRLIKDSKNNLIAETQIKYKQLIDDPKLKYCEVDEDCDIAYKPGCCSCPKTFNKELAVKINNLPNTCLSPYREQVQCAECLYDQKCQERECIKCINNSCEIVFPSPEKQSVEKEVFVDESRNLNITFLIWREDEEFNIELIKIELIKPDGTVIDKEMVAGKPNIEWSVFPIKSWGVDENVKVSIYVSRPELGTWKIRATPTNNKKLPKFRVSSYGSGTTAIIFYLESPKNSYPNAEEPSIRGILSGPVVVKGAEISGIVIHPSGSKTDFKLHDDGLEEHGDDYANDGRYYNFFRDFSTNGYYKFEMTANNVNGMTVEPGDSPYISLPPPGVPLPESKPVPPFTRTTDLTIEIK